jgi:hypothetical protein
VFAFRMREPLTSLQLSRLNPGTPARLHHIRGHIVHRRGSIFWRHAHLRGDVAGAVGTRTVTVTAARHAASPPAVRIAR